MYMRRMLTDSKLAFDDTFIAIVVLMYTNLFNMLDMV